MPAERMFLTKERVIRDGVLLHGINQRIPQSRVQELGLSMEQVEPVNVGRGAQAVSRLRRLPDFMSQTTRAEAAEDEEPFDELPPPPAKPLIREKPQRAEPKQPSQTRVRRVPDTAKRRSETNVKPSEDRT